MNTLGSNVANPAANHTRGTSPQSRPAGKSPVRRLKVGIIGAGGIATKLHLPELKRIESVDVVVLSGRRKSRLETLCRMFDVPRWTQNYDEVLADPGIDAVVISLPHPLHVKYGLQALHAGKHVHIQKPLSTSMEEANQFVEAVEHGDRIVLALPYVSRSVLLAAREIIASKTLGKVSSAHARYSHGGPEIYYATVQAMLEEVPEDKLWFFDKQQADVGALFDMGVYSVATLITLCGSIRTVTARCTTVDKPTELEDTAALLLDFASGALGTAETGWCDGARTAEFSVPGTEGKLTCPGSNGALSHYRPSSKVDEDAPLVHQPIDVSRFPDQNSHEHWIECIRAGRQPPLANARSARHVTEVLLAGLESSRTGTRIDIQSRIDDTD
jgi:predicted dehydrogenase